MSAVAEVCDALIDGVFKAGGIDDRTAAALHAKLEAPPAPEPAPAPPAAASVEPSPVAQDAGLSTEAGGFGG